MAAARLSTAPRTVSILGATGSVGRSTLDLIEREPERFEVLALTALQDVSGLAEAARRVGAKRAVIGDPAFYQPLKEALSGTEIEPAAGEQAIAEAAGSGADWTMAAIVGCAGLRPVMAALEAGGTVALANKEALVSAGDIMTQAARDSGATLLPVDSEHNAIFQCFDRSQPERVSRIVLTASGGPFRTLSLDEMRGVTPAQAVAHPNWSMGAKISVDCATLMNKGLELIEAFHLFPLGADAFDVIVHPQSVIHSMVEYIDGSVLAQLGAPDMRIPIAYTLAYPERMETPCERLDLVKTGSLTFEAPDLERFPALALARSALEAGGAKPAILNAANEIAVASFLEGGLSFLDIAAVAQETLACYDPPAPASLDEVLEVDRQARGVARAAVGKLLH
jgi:1-deoxy-D-xylulose-5-phosphate reductoisomerase